MLLPRQQQSNSLLLHIYILFRWVVELIKINKIIKQYNNNNSRLSCKYIKYTFLTTTDDDDNYFFNYY